MKTNLKYIKEFINKNNIDITKNFFVLSSETLSLIDELRKEVNYNYSSPLGRSVLRSFYYSIQKQLNKNEYE